MGTDAHKVDVSRVKVEGAFAEGTSAPQGHHQQQCPAKGGEGVGRENCLLTCLVVRATLPDEAPSAQPMEATPLWEQLKV